MNFWDSRARVISLIDNLRSFAPTAFQHETMTRIADAWVVVDGEPMTIVAEPVEHAIAISTDVAEPTSLPISKSSAVACARWMVNHFADALRTAVIGKAYKVKHLCGIVCQESAYKWLKWIQNHDTETIIARCVFDASGDYPGKPRSAFPKNTASFRTKYGDPFTDMLIEEANLTRRMQGWGNKDWVYKGYGIFQYDLQHVKSDTDFFRNKKWYSFSACLDRCCRELDTKLQKENGDLWRAIKRYNGTGVKAEQYMRNVKFFTQYCAEVTGD